MGQLLCATSFGLRKSLHKYPMSISGNLMIACQRLNLPIPVIIPGPSCGVPQLPHEVIQETLSITRAKAFFLNSPDLLPPL